MNTIEDLITKYDINNAFKQAVSNLLEDLDRDDTIEILTNKVVDILYTAVWESDYLSIDDGGNVHRDITKNVKSELKNMFNR